MSSTQQLLLGEGAGGGPPVFIEDVFSTYLYTGTGSSRTIINDIDLSTKGGLVWTKARTILEDHRLVDTVRGATKAILSNKTQAEVVESNGLTSFSSTGYTVVSDPGYNGNTNPYVSWTFREQPKFFDIVTYTGNGVSGRQIAHSLGSVPGCMLVKCLSIAEGFTVYHRSEGATKFGLLYDTDAFAASLDRWNNTTPTSTVFTVGDAAKVNGSGQTYVAYLFAHDAGGFGLTGTDNVISCGSFTTDGSGNGSFQNLGYEPQLVIQKVSSSGTGSWYITDNMRGMSKTNTQLLLANTTAAEATEATEFVSLSANGFTPINNLMPANKTCIYIAIRRGPMKVPTSGTSVFAPAIRTGTGADATITSSTYPVDMTWIRQTNGSTGYSFMDFDRLRGPLKLLYTNNDQSQNNTSYTVTGFDVQNGYYLGDDSLGYGVNVSSQPIVYYNFKRAPGFFDEVCYIGNDVSGRTITHNLAAVPELMIVKSRSRSGENWVVYSFALGTTIGTRNLILLNSNLAATTDSTGPQCYGNGTTITPPTSSVFTVGTETLVNRAPDTYVAYLFATCAGVSKVGSYTGNGTTQTINCGFTGGARFVLIKHTDATGDWYVYDTARGMTLLTDPYLLLNSANAQVATLGSVTTVSTGFALDSTILAAINVSAGTYIFLAIA